MISCRDEYIYNLPIIKKNFNGIRGVNFTAAFIRIALIKSAISR